MPMFDVGIFILVFTTGAVFATVAWFVWWQTEKLIQQTKLDIQMATLKVMKLRNKIDKLENDIKLLEIKINAAKIDAEIAKEAILKGKGHGR